MRQARRALGVMMVTALLGLPAGANAAGWLQAQTFTAEAVADGDGVVTADGTILQGATIYPEGGSGTPALVRQVPGRDPEVVDLTGDGEVEDVKIAAGSDGTVAAAVVANVGEASAVLRVRSWARGATSPTTTTKTGLPKLWGVEFALLEGGRFAALGSSGEGEVRQVTGTLGGAATVAPLRGAGDQPLNAMHVAARPGRPPVLLATASGGGAAGTDILLSRAGPDGFPPPSVIGNGPPHHFVNWPLVAIAPDGGVAIAYETRSYNPETAVHHMQLHLARVDADGTLADDRVAATGSTAAGSTQMALERLAATPGGGQVASFLRYATAANGAPTNRRIVMVVRAPGARDPAEEQDVGEDRGFLPLIGDAAGGVRVVVHSGDSFSEWVLPAGGTVFGEPQPLMKLDHASVVTGDGVAALVGIDWATRANVVRLFDGAPPVLDFASVADGELALRFTAKATDLSGAPAITWEFGDGGTATGTEVRHVFARPGTHTVRATATDALGQRTTVERAVEVAAAPRPLPPGPVAPIASRDLTAPVLSNVRLAAKRVRRGRTASLRFAVDEAATVRLVLKRKVGTARTISSRMAAGARRLKISTRRLKPGRYRLTLVATDAAGNASRPATATLTVTGAKKRKR